MPVRSRAARSAEWPRPGPPPEPPPEPDRWMTTATHQWREEAQLETRAPAAGGWRARPGRRGGRARHAAAPRSPLPPGPAPIPGPCAGASRASPPRAGRPRARPRRPAPASVAAPRGRCRGRGRPGGATSPPPAARSLPPPPPAPATPARGRTRAPGGRAPSPPTARSPAHPPRRSRPAAAPGTAPPPAPPRPPPGPPRTPPRRTRRGRVQPHLVARRGEHVLPQVLAQHVERLGERAPRRVRCVLGPEQADEPLASHRAAAGQRQHRQQGDAALVGGASGHGPVVPEQDGITQDVQVEQGLPRISSNAL